MRTDAGRQVGSSSEFLSDRLADLRRSLLGYGPFRFAEPILWLFIASLLRVLLHVHPALIVLLIPVQFAIVFAFVSATARIVEQMRGSTALGALSFADTFAIARTMLRRIFAIIVACATYAIALKQLGAGIDPQALLPMLLIIDGIAFDTFGAHVKIMCSISALILFMMTIDAGTQQPVTISAALKRICEHRLAMAAATGLAASFLMALSSVQGLVRPYAVAWMRALETVNDTLATAPFFIFVVGFAVVRLMTLVAIFAFFLRTSCERRAG